MNNYIDLEMLQKPSEVLENGMILKHKNYEEQTPINFKMPLQRNVIKQHIANKYDFIDFVNEYKTEQTKIFFNETTIRAIFNYPTTDKADYEDSFVEMDMVKTRDYREFVAILGKDISQKQFIRTLKRLEPYIIAFDNKKVDDMDIIEIAENLSATTNIHSVQRNTSNAFMLDAEVKTGASNITIPRYITFELPVYKNDLSLKSQFTVELFLDVKDSSFVATLECYKLEQIQEETIKELTSQICRGCTGVESFLV